MKELKFKTSKREFIIYDKVDITQTQLIFFNQYGIKLSEITEEQASEIVDEFKYHPTLIKKVFIDYLNGDFYIDTAIESLHSLLKSKGIHLFENPIDLEEQLDCNCDMCYQKLEDAFNEAEQKTFYNPYIFKL